MPRQRRVTCFTRTKVQILTPEVAREGKRCPDRGEGRVGDAGASFSFSFSFSLTAGEANGRTVGGAVEDAAAVALVASVCVLLYQ